MKDASEDEEEDDEFPMVESAEAKEKADANRKAKSQREAHLRKMMEDNDEGTTTRPYPTIPCTTKANHPQRLTNGRLPGSTTRRRRQRIPRPSITKPLHPRLPGPRTRRPTPTTHLHHLRRRPPPGPTQSAQEENHKRRRRLSRHKGRARLGVLFRRRAPAQESQVAARECFHCGQGEEKRCCCCWRRCCCREGGTGEHHVFFCEEMRGVFLILRPCVCIYDSLNFFPENITLSLSLSYPSTITVVIILLVFSPHT